MTVQSEAADSYLSGLRALRDHVAAAIDAGPPPRELAPLAARLQSVLEAIEEASPTEVQRPTTSLDEIRAKRDQLTKKTG